MGDEQPGVLKLRAVSGIRIQDQLSVGNVLLQSEGVDARHHDVVVAVRHQRGLRNVPQIGVALAARLRPVDDGGDLTFHGLDGGRRISIFALGTPLPEGTTRSLTGRRRREEQMQEVILGGHRIARDLHHARRGTGLAVARPGADEYQAAHEFGKAMREALRDEAADGEAEHIHRRHTQCAREAGDAIGHAVDGGSRLASGTGHPGIVDQDDGAPLCEAVRDEGIPVVHAATEVLQEHQRRSGLRAKAAKGEADSVRIEELRGRREVRVGRHGNLVSGESQGSGERPFSHVGAVSVVGDA